MIEKIPISKDLSNYIEALQYDVQGLQDLLARMNINEDNEINEFWLNKYLETNKEYKLSRAELERLLKSKISTTNTFTWNLDFDTSEVTVEYDN